MQVFYKFSRTSVCIFALYQHRRPSETVWCNVRSECFYSYPSFHIQFWNTKAWECEITSHAICDEIHPHKNGSIIHHCDETQAFSWHIKHFFAYLCGFKVSQLLHLWPHPQMMMCWFCSAALHHCSKMETLTTIYGHHHDHARSNSDICRNLRLLFFVN